MAQNFLVEIILSWVEQVLSGWSCKASLPDGSLPDNIVSVFIEGNFKVISCLCLWIIRWSSVGKRCQTNREKREKGEEPFSFVIYICHYREQIYSALQMWQAKQKKLFWKGVKAWVSKMINYFLWANILGCSFELFPNICIIIATIINQGLNYVVKKSGWVLIRHRRSLPSIILWLPTPPLGIPLKAFYS